MHTKSMKVRSLVAVSVVGLMALTASASPGGWGTAYDSDDNAHDLDSVNALGQAMLTETIVTNIIPVGKKLKSIVFTQDNLNVASITLDETLVAGALSVSSAAGVTLVATNTVSMFNLSGDVAWSFSNLKFKGTGDLTGAAYDGGAICVDGGTLDVRSCSFTNLMTHFSGGAISARMLTGDSIVSNCQFYANASHPINGYGGALYASAADEDVYFYVIDSVFDGNSAENGGAICTFTAIEDDEKPITLEIAHSEAGQAVFSHNKALYSGGAIVAEGAFDIAGTNVNFMANEAGLMGGAICVNGVVNGFALPWESSIEGATFADNRVATNKTWVAGGAVAVMPAGCQISYENVTFTNNVATTEFTDCTSPALGGAVYAGKDVTNTFTRCMFVDNTVKANATVSSKKLWCYGGAISVEGAATTVDTCVFDCGSAAYAQCYGNAIDFNGTVAVLKNSTFRRGQMEAVSTYKGSLAVTNCVLLGNALAGDAADLYLYSTPATMAYTAYGTVSNATPSTTKLTATNCLADRVAADVYAGDTLRLAETNFNPVAGLGLEQSATDFDGVAYGSKNYGYSMGAYEAATEKAIVLLKGDKDYDGSTSSNKCVWTWSLYTNTVDETTSYSWSDLGTVDNAFDIKNWVFGSSAVGYYDSTNASPNNITAAVAPTTEEVTWLATLLDYRYQGEIRKESTNILVVVVPLEYEWTGTAITPGKNMGNVTVTNSATNTEVPQESEYTLEWFANVDPTNKAYVVVTATNNYDFVSTNYFHITAYLTEYKFDDVLSNITTNGALSTSNVVAVTNFYQGYCLDYQNSTTNATVYKYNAEHDKPAITTMTVLYCTDVVGGTDENDPYYPGDGIPDKYQRRVIFATVNGDWNNTSNRYDIVKWLTLTNATDGTWSTAGSCSISADIIPGVGDNPDYHYAGGSWLTSPTNVVIGSGAGTDSFPIYFFEPGYTADPTRPVLRAGASNDTATGYTRALRTVGFEIGADDSLAGEVEAVILNNGAVVKAYSLQGTKLEVLGKANLGDEWYSLGEVETDANGQWSLGRMPSVPVSATVSTDENRNSNWNVGEYVQPQFFTVRMVGE